MHTSLHIAVTQGHATVMEKLLAAHCNVDLQRKDGVTPLHLVGGSFLGGGTTALIFYVALTY